MVVRSFIVLVASLAACGSEDTPDGPAPRGVLSTDAGDAARGGADGGEGGNGEDAATGPEYSGEATYYDANGTGACGFAASSDFLVAAINAAQYSKDHCGKCVSVDGPRGTVVVRITDKCPGCGSGGLDLSQTAFAKIARLADGRVKITWHFVPCP
jgi:expansin (peptidoglycan-binding protein)